MISFQSCISTPHPLMGTGFSSVGSNEHDHSNRPGDAPKVVQKDLKHQSRTRLSWQLLSKCYLAGTSTFSERFRVRWERKLGKGRRCGSFLRRWQWWTRFIQLPVSWDRLTHSFQASHWSIEWQTCHSNDDDFITTWWKDPDNLENEVFSLGDNVKLPCLAENWQEFKL